MMGGDSRSQQTAVVDVRRCERDWHGLDKNCQIIASGEYGKGSVSPQEADGQQANEFGTLRGPGSRLAALECVKLWLPARSFRTP
jgi:hypothetical protein